MSVDPKVSVEDLLVHAAHGTVLNRSDTRIDGVRNVGEAGPSDATFAKGVDRAEAAGRTRAGLVVTDLAEATVRDFDNFDGRIWVLVPDPRLVIARMAQHFVRPREEGVHPTAVVADDAVLGDHVHIGAHSSVGRGVRIGEGTWIGPGVHIYPDVVIGADCSINANTVVGTDGFGYERAGEEWVKIPHLGSVVVEDDVEIGACTTIDRGTFGDTVIGRGARIDNLVHVAHNVRVGPGAMVIALSMIGGSVDIGASAWVAPSSTLMNGIAIGTGATTGLGAVVIRDVADGDVVAGVPAKSLRR